MNYVVLASDQYAHYAFYVPLTCAVWQARGYTPLLMLVGTEKSWSTGPREVALRFAREAGAVVRFLGNFPGRTATVAQVARLFAEGIFDLGPDAYLLTSDIDMWPTGSWVGGSRDESLLFQLYYANAYKDEGKVHFPMCYVGARVNQWHEVMSETDLPGALALSAVRPVTAEDVRLAHPVNGERIPLSVWNFDEDYFGECLSKWPGFPGACQLISRDMEKHGERRLDRSAWRDVGSLDGYADVHLPRPGFSTTNWPSVKKVFGLIVPERAGWADTYYGTLVEQERAHRMVRNEARGNSLVRP